MEESFSQGEASQGRISAQRGVEEEGAGICVTGEAADKTLCKVKDGT